MRTGHPNELSEFQADLPLKSTSRDFSSKPSSLLWRSNTHDINCWLRIVTDNLLTFIVCKQCDFLVQVKYKRICKDAKM